MNYFFRPPGIFIFLLLACATLAHAQVPGAKINRVDIKYIGPASVSEALIRDNVKLKAGSTYLPGGTQDDVHSLYATGQFYNIRVSLDQADDGGVIVTYIVQVRPRITDIKIEGNHKLKTSKLRKKVTVKVGDALDEQKLFTDVQEMKKLYEKSGYSETKVKYVLNIDEATGHGSVTYQIQESPKVKIIQVNFLGAEAFTQKQLRKEVKTRAHWMWSWLTGSGYFQQDEFDADADKLAEFYHSKGYLDFEVKDTKLEYPTTNTMIVKYYLFEGHQYKVGSVKFSGEKIFTDAEIIAGLRVVRDFQGSKAKLGANNLPMDTGNIFTPEGLTKDTEAVQDFYGSKGYIEIAQGQAMRVKTVPNVEQGTIDLDFEIGESQRSYVQKIEIHGNLKTKDKVIRRELAISPGDVFDMVRVKISKQRLEGLQYFSKVETRPDQTDPPIAGRKNLLINVEEQNTGNMSVGAGFSSVDALVGYAEISQGNFDLFHPPYFTGGGQKIRLRVQLGTQRQDYELSFTEPWFMNRKLSLGISLYRHQLNFESPNGIYDETRTGGKVSLTRALGSDFVIGSVSYTLEDIGISLNPGWHGQRTVNDPNQVPQSQPPNVPNAILDQVGNNLYQRFGASLAYDTRNSTQLPNHGQRTEISTEMSVGSTDFYKLEARSAWYFPGLFKGHVLELLGRTGVADSLQGGDVPFYDRYYLGGLYSLRGFQFRNIAPRQGPTVGVTTEEPIGGDTYWFSSAEYSVPIFEKEGGVSLRFALFYDIGAVDAHSYSYSLNYLSDWGMGMRLNIPHLGPLRLDYGIPLQTDKYNNGSGQFQFGVGYTREF
ncbi:MAG TPA: outer membrane protein assembly factor BamA [bacterium]|nr:outer membrane protein assembly factor BamA [bacterium]